VFTCEYSSFCLSFIISSFLSNNNDYEEEKKTAGLRRIECTQEILSMPVWHLQEILSKHVLDLQKILSRPV
jgi:hypothetical protein